jgi:hypothetical protein
MSRRLFPPLVVLALAGLLSGCGGGPGKFKVSGKVTQSKAGSPLKEFPPKSGMLTVMLIPVVEGGKGGTNVPLQTDLNGTINEKPDVPTGKYKVSIEVKLTPAGTDELGGKFSPEKTKIIKEIKGDTVLEIDLSKDE